MNINALTTLLQELAYQSSSKVSPAEKAEGASRVRDAIAAGGKPAAGAGPAGAQINQAEAKLNQEQLFIPPAFAPLPMRSELFQEARFFARLNERNAGTAVHQAQASDIYICLITENLGRVWVNLTYRNDELLVKCFTDQDSSNKVIRKNLPLLQEDLMSIGFKEVFISSQARHELGAVVEGLLPKFEMHLLDRKI